MSPRDGTHINLKTGSLVGWKQCHRGKYIVDFDATVLTDKCNGERLLVACRSVSDRTTLIVAGIGKREDILRSCLPNSYCTPEMKNGTGFYYVQNQVWGFQGRPKVRVDILGGTGGFKLLAQYILISYRNLLQISLPIIVECRRDHFV